MQNELFFWDWRMVGHLYVGGVSAGGFLLAVLLYNLNSRRYEQLVKKLLLIGPIGLLIALIFGLMALKNGLSGLLAFASNDPGSDGVIGLYLHLLFIPLAFWVAAQSRRNYTLISPPMLIITGLIAFGIALFHGALLLWANLPFWSEALLAMMVLGALVGGTMGGWALARKPFGTLPPPGEEEITINLPRILVPLLGFLVLMSFFWLVALGGGEPIARMALLYLMDEKAIWLFGVVYGLGFFLPLALLTSQMFKKMREPGRVLSLVCASAVLTGLLVLEWLIIHLGKGL